MAADLNPDWLSCIPSFWTYGVTRDGRVFFINEEAKSTTWLHPVTGEAVITGHRKTPDLPTGWEEGYTFEGARCFINHNEQKVTCKHPITGSPSQDTCIFILNEQPAPKAPASEKKDRPISTMTDASNYTSSSDYIPRPGSPPGRPSRSSKKVHNFGKRSNSIKRNPNAPVVRSGWLYKQDSAGMKLWKKRWFVLSDMCLFYYRDEKEEVVLGSILLPSFHISMLSVEDHISKKYAFKATHPNMRTYYFCTDVAKDMEAWMRAMTDAALVHTEPIKRQKLEPCLPQEANSTQCRRARSQPEVCGLDRSQPEVCGLDRSQPEVCGLDRSQPEVCGLDRSQPEVCGLDRSQPEVCGQDWPREAGGPGALEQGQADGERGPLRPDGVERERPRPRARGARLQPGQAAAIVAAVMSCSQQGGAGGPQENALQLNGSGGCSPGDGGGDAPPAWPPTCATPLIDSSHSQDAPHIDPACCQPPPQPECDQYQPPPQQEFDQSQAPPQPESDQSFPYLQRESDQFQPPQQESDQLQPPQRESDQSQPLPQTDSVQSVPYLQRESDQSQPPPQTDSAQSLPPPQREFCQSQPPLQIDSALPQVSHHRDISYSQTLPKRDSTHSYAPPQIDSAHSHAPHQRCPSYSQTLPRRESTQSHAPPQRDSTFSNAPPQTDSAHSEAPPYIGSTHPQAPPQIAPAYSQPPPQVGPAQSQAPPQIGSAHIQAPPPDGEKSLQRTSSMQQLEQWVRLQRGRIQEDDTDSVASYLTLPRKMPSQRSSQGVPHYPEGYRTLPRNSVMRPGSVCSLAPSLYDRALGPTAAEKRRSMRDDTMWQLYEWRLRQSCPKHAPLRGSYSTLPNPRSLARPSDRLAPSIPLSPSHGSLAHCPPALTARAHQGAMTMDRRHRTHVTQYVYPPPDRRNLSSGVQLQPVSTQSLQGKTPEELTLLLIKLRRQQADLSTARQHTLAQLLQISLHGNNPKNNVLSHHLKRNLQFLDSQMRENDPLIFLSHTMIENSAPRPQLYQQTVPEDYRDNAYMYRQGNLDLDVKLSRLCEQDKVVRTQEHKLQQLYREKHTLETALLSASQEIEMSAGDQLTLQAVVQQRDLLQSGLLSTCRELGRVNTGLERSWRELAQLESDVTLIRNNLLLQLEALGTPQTEPPSQQHVQIQKELWRIQDVTEALSKNRTQRVTEPQGFLSSQAAPSQQKSEEADPVPPRPPLPQYYDVIGVSAQRAGGPATPPRPDDRKQGQRNGAQSTPDYRLCKSEPELTTVSEVEEINTEDKMDAALEKESATTGLSFPVGVVSPRTKSPLMESSSVTSYVTLRKNRKQDPRADRPRSAAEQASVETGRPRMSVEEQLERIRRHQEGTLRGRKKPPAAVGVGLENFRTLQSRRRGDGSPTDIQDLLASLRAKQKEPEPQREQKREQEPETQLEQGQGPEKQLELEQGQGPEKQLGQEEKQELEKEPEQKQEQGPEKEQKLLQEPEKEPEQEQKQEPEKEPEPEQEPAKEPEQKQEQGAEVELDQEQEPEKEPEQLQEAQKEQTQEQGSENEGEQEAVKEQELEKEQDPEQMEEQKIELMKEEEPEQMKGQEQESVPDQNPVEEPELEKEQKQNEAQAAEQEQKPVEEQELVKDQKPEDAPKEEQELDHVVEREQNPVDEQELVNEQNHEDEPKEEQELVNEQKREDEQKEEQELVKEQELEHGEEQEQNPVKEPELAKEREQGKEPAEEQELVAVEESEQMKGQEQKEQKPEQDLAEEPKNDLEKGTRDPTEEQKNTEREEQVKEESEQNQVSVSRPDQRKEPSEEPKDNPGTEEQEEEQVKEPEILTEANMEPLQTPPQIPPRTPPQPQELCQDPKVPEVLIREEDAIKALVVRNSVVVQVVNSNPEARPGEVTEQDQGQLISSCERERADVKGLPSLPLCPAPPSTPPQLTEGSHFMCV
ncbi:pleckstrin homology domain-containing family A member 5-like [Conger conger]|uniref:pleckstrin homology domain-containing family A member 5-like n=1 Tax=Conger conger TaxID=82655 RepID=UPI002A5A27F3|nr:pleckstrin homology domain-containing family A member 5-like [Conger conger]